MKKAKISEEAEEEEDEEHLMSISAQLIFQGTPQRSRRSPQSHSLATKLERERERERARQMAPSQ